MFTGGSAAKRYPVPIRAAAAACSGIIGRVLIGIAVIAALPGARALAADLEVRTPPPVAIPNWSGPSAAEPASGSPELLRELVPGAVRIAVLVNPANPNAETVLRDVKAAALAMGLQIQVHNIGTIGEIDTAFADFVRQPPHALFVGPDPFFRAMRVHLALLAAHHRLPATYSLRDYAEAGGLMSYGASLNDAFRQVGTYVGRILKGEKPADLPVVQSTKFELVINLQPARMLGLTVPPTLLTTADVVIE